MEQMFGCPRCGSPLTYGEVTTTGQRWSCPKCGENSQSRTYTVINETLPTKEEFERSITHFRGEYSEPKYICPKCGGGMCKNLSVTLTSYPERYEYLCNKCGNIEYHFA